MKHVLLRLLCAVLALLLCAAIPAMAEDQDALFQQALQEEIERWGDVYTWSFEKKADFYNTYRYHGVGTRRGLPCAHVLQKDAIIEAATQYMLTVVGVSEEELATYIIDVDYWIEAFPEEDREHEYYVVLYFTQTVPHQFRSEYQLMISPYNGDVLEFIDLDEHRQ